MNNRGLIINEVVRNLRMTALMVYASTLFAVGVIVLCTVTAFVIGREDSLVTIGQTVFLVGIPGIMWLAYGVLSAGTAYGYKRYQRWAFYLAQFLVWWGWQAGRGRIRMDELRELIVSPSMHQAFGIVSSRADRRM